MRKKDLTVERKREILDCFDEIRSSGHKDLIQHGYRLESFIFSELMRGENKKTQLIIRNKKTLFTQVQNQIDGYLNNNKNNKNYYQPKVAIKTPKKQYEVDAIYIEGSTNTVYFIEIKKNIKVDTTNITGMYDKLADLRSFYGKKWNVKSIIVGFENDIDKIYKTCRLHKSFKNESDFKLLSGTEFCDRLGFDFKKTLIAMKDDDALLAEGLDICDKYYIKV